MAASSVTAAPRAIRTGGAVALAVAGLTACTATEAGEPLGSGSPTSARLAPALDEPPLDVQPLLDKPCDVLSAEQVASWGVRSPQPVPEERAYDGPSCSFQPNDAAGIFFGTTIQLTGLEAVYQQGDTLAVFEPTEIAGYPGVFNDTRTLAHSVVADSLWQLPTIGRWTCLSP